MPKETAHKKKSRLDGLHQSRRLTKASKEPPLQTREAYVKELPIHSGDPNKDGVVEFELKLGLHEWGRFLPAPFMAHYYFTIKNPRYEKPPEGKTTKDPPTIPATKREETMDYLYVERPVLFAVPAYKETLLYLPPELGMSALFSHAEVYINGMKIGDDTDMMNQNKVYQALNRIYATQKQRIRVNQEVLDTDDVSAARIKERKVNKTAATSPVTMEEVFRLPEKAVKLQKSMVSESYMKKQYVSNRFALDGNFALAPPFCNALASLRHQEEGNVCGFLPPGTVIVVRLHPRYPRFSMVQHLRNEYKYTFPENEAELEKTKARELKPDSLQVEFIKLVMCYESVTLPDELSNKQLSRTLNYPFNRVQIDICSFEPNHQQVVLKSRVPAGSKAAFVVFLREEQLWYNKGSHRNLSNYFAFPRALTKLAFQLNDHGPLLSKEGLKNIEAKSQAYSFSLSSYYENYIAGKRITDVPFDQMFTRFTDKGVSRTQSLFLDLQKYYIRENTQMTITSDYNGDLSPSKTKLVICYVTDSNLRRSSNGVWTLENIV